jgi:hypothetical protein
MTASVAGCTAAPPTPMSARQAMSCSGPLLKAASSEPTEKIVSPISSVLRRPMRSPTTPHEKSSPANTST